MSNLWAEAITAREQFATVHRVEDPDGSSSIEPPLDAAWDEITQLRWKAAVVEHETGIRIIVTGPYHNYNDEREHYSLNIGRASIGSSSFDTCWTLLNGVTLGAQTNEESHDEGDPDNPYWTARAQADRAHLARIYALIEQTEAEWFEWTNPSIDTGSLRAILTDGRTKDTE